MNRFSEQARYVPELPRNAELLRITGIRLQRIHFFDDASLDVCEVLSQVRTPLPLDLFFKHLSIAAKQQLFLWQMQRVLALSGSYSLNLSVRMLTSLSWITRLTKQVHQGRIVIGQSISRAGRTGCDRGGGNAAGLCHLPYERRRCCTGLSI